MLLLTGRPDKEKYTTRDRDDPEKFPRVQRTWCGRTREKLRRKSRCLRPVRGGSSKMPSGEQRLCPARPGKGRTESYSWHEDIMNDGEDNKMTEFTSCKPPKTLLSAQSCASSTAHTWPNRISLLGADPPAARRRPANTGQTQQWERLNSVYIHNLITSITGRAITVSRQGTNSHN